MTQSVKLDAYACIDEVPLHRVRGNQLGILLCIIATLITQQFWILVLPLLVQIISRTYGVRYNARPGFSPLCCLPVPEPRAASCSVSTICWPSCFSS